VSVVNRLLPGDRTHPIAPFLALLLAATVACSSGGTSSGYQSGSQGLSPAVTLQQYGGQYSGGMATGDTQEGAAFARWVLDQDPQRQYLTDAVVRGDQTLGVRVQPTITKGDAQRLLTALAMGMARTFPNRPVEVDAFYQSGQKLAQANVDPGSGRVTVQFV
jgi:hypothetical protein